MSNSKINDILSSAYVLPATSGLGLLYLNNTHPAIVVGLFAVSVISFILLLGSICRFVINTRRQK